MRGVGWGLGSFFKIGLIALVFIVLAKWVATKVNVPGLSSAVAGA
jgi:hypothetical protein